MGYKVLVFTKPPTERHIHYLGGKADVRAHFDRVIDASGLFFRSSCRKNELGVATEQASSVVFLYFLLRELRDKYVLVYPHSKLITTIVVAWLLRLHEMPWGVVDIKSMYASNVLGLKKRRSPASILVKVKKYAIDLLMPSPDHFFTNRKNAYFGKTKASLIDTKEYYAWAKGRGSLSNIDQSKLPFLAFLDQSIPRKYSIEKSGYRGIFDKDKTQNYYADLNKYLVEASNEYGLNVVVCLHPSARLEDKEWFDERIEVVHLETGTYAANASLIVTHFSNSTAFAHLSGVPLLLLNMKAVMPCQLQNRIDEFSRASGFQVQNWPAPIVELSQLHAVRNTGVIEFLKPCGRGASLLQSIDFHVVRKKD